MLRGMQQQQQHGAAPQRRLQAPRPPLLRVRSSANGNGASSCPTPAETARTVADLAGEGVLCTLSCDGLPLGTPVAYSLDAAGNPLLQLVPGSPEAANLSAGGRAALLVQPAAFPARGLASVALQGTAAQPEPAEAAAAGEGAQLLKLQVERCVYYGGLDHVSASRGGRGSSRRERPMHAAAHDGVCAHSSRRPSCAVHSAIWRAGTQQRTRQVAGRRRALAVAAAARASA